MSGERRGHHSVSVRTQSPGRHAEIHAAHISTVLVVRQSGRSLALSVLSPRSVVEAFGPQQDLQLCVWGCPTSQRLNTLRPSTNPPSSPAASSKAHAHCGALLSDHDVYFKACVFDVISTGDLNASAAAVAARRDARDMVGNMETVHLLPLASAPTHLLQTHLLLLLSTLPGILSAA